MKTKVLIISLLIFSIFFAYTQDTPDALELYNNKQYADAVKVCLSEIEEMPRNMDSYVVLGWSLLALGKYEDAKTYSTKALAINRWDYRIIKNMGEALYFLGENRDALDYFEK